MAAAAAGSSSFTQTVVAAMRHLYPEQLADKTFDNTGLLLEAPTPPSSSSSSSSSSLRQKRSVLLTIDLTGAVADEAISGGFSVVVAYHPIIFRGLKSITLSDPQQASLLRLASHGVSAYSPHTAVDTVPGGMADWLCDIVTGREGASVKPPPLPLPSSPVLPTSTEDRSQTPTRTPTSTAAEEADTKEKKNPPKPQRKALQRTYSQPEYPQSYTNSSSNANTALSNPTKLSTDKEVVVEEEEGEGEGEEGEGEGEEGEGEGEEGEGEGEEGEKGETPHERSVITPSPSSDISAANAAHPASSSSSSSTSPSSSASSPYNAQNTGAGRLVTFTTPQPLGELITRIANAIGQPKGFPVAIPQSYTPAPTPVPSSSASSLSSSSSPTSTPTSASPPAQGASITDIPIRTVGICPGSGASVIRSCRPYPPDLTFTGEMSHHDALAVTERGGCVVSLFHSNSERGYLSVVMREKLEEEVRKRWRGRGDREDRATTDDDDDDGDVSVVVSSRDRDPFGIVVLQEEQDAGIDLD